MTNLFFTLLAIALGNKGVEGFPALKDEDWLQLLEEAKRQASIGVIWLAIEKLPAEKQPSLKPKMRWYGYVNLIEKQNKLANKACEDLTRAYDALHLDSVILKGQSLVKYYPTPYCRQSGDIDIWVKPKESQAHSCAAKIEEIRRTIDDANELKVGHIVYHHAEWVYENLPVEIHFRPLYINNPWHNSFFQKWCVQEWQKSSVLADQPFHSATIEFNLVYILFHIYHHLLFEGVGLRQVCDYAVLLNYLHQHYSAEKREQLKADTYAILCKLGLEKFAHGMMWVLVHACGMSEETLLVVPDESVGRFIMSEILQTGNMGFYDTRKDKNRSVAANRTKHRLRFLTLFPSEIIWDIPFRIGHYVWRWYYQKKYGWK